MGVAVSAWYVTNYLGVIPVLTSIRNYTVAFGLLATRNSFIVTAAGIDVTKRMNLILIAFIFSVLVVIMGSAEPTVTQTI